MDGKANETWCMLRCAGGGVHDNEIINRTMLRFRPIAPKPITTGPDSGTDNHHGNNLLVTSKISKRKYVRVRRNISYNRKKKNISNENTSTKIDDEEQTIVTLQLLPEKPDSENTTTDELSSWCKKKKLVYNSSGNGVYQEDRNFKSIFNVTDQGGGDVDEFGTIDRTVVVSPRRVVESWVTVESVTDICMDATRSGGLGYCTDVDMMKNLEKDTCPGFISDGLNRVQWVNGAYKRMVAAVRDDDDDNGQSSQPPETVVWLVMKEKLMSCLGLYSSFTTRVKLQYTWKKEKNSQMVPCDVCRMDFGGFAWRLDTQAALSLGR